MNLIVGLTLQSANRRGDIKIVALALEIGNLCKSVAELLAQVHKLKSRELTRMPRSNLRHNESDDVDANAMMVAKPPDKVAVGNENPPLDFLEGW
jgi:hypothetical protein